jgi:NADH-quinone oxidoreductase subunit D
MGKSSGQGRETTFTVPFGPQHPASGHFRASVRLAGEKVIELTPYPGYLHRGMEKLMEYRTHEQNAVFVNRLCVLEPYSWELGYANVAERVAGVEAPERAKFIRTIMAELGRILSHITWVGVMSMALGFESANRIAWGDREKIIRLTEIVSGGRIYPCHLTPGGVRRDFPVGFERKILDVLDYLEKRLDFYDDLFFNNAAVIERTEGVGVLDTRKAIESGAVGPNLRACGMGSDVRKDEPYDAYPEADFRVITRKEGDSYARVLCRREEIAESISIIRQLLEKMSRGKIRNRLPWEIPKRDAYFCFEAARGEACFYMVGNGTDKPYRVKVKGPSFLHSLMVFPYSAKGAQMADVPAIYWSLDPCPADMDR